MDRFFSGLEKIKNYFTNENNYLNISSEALKKFLEHYNNLSESISEDIELIKKAKLPGYIRSYLWLIFLDILPKSSPDTWKNIIDDKRSDYFELRNKYITEDINNYINSSIGKGSDEYENYKQKITEKNINILDLIKLDIDRTYQECFLFQKKEIKHSLVKILYIYSKVNGKEDYKQGMNEICAVLMYGIYKDYSFNCDSLGDEISFLFYVLHSNNEFIEADTFNIFNKIMNKDILDFYCYSNIKYKKSVLSTKPIEEKLQFTEADIENCEDCLIKKRIYKVFYLDLKKADNKLFDLLKDKVDPELFLLRWYLCLFSREFPLDKIVYLWDLILCYEFIEFNICKSKTKNKLNICDCISIGLMKLIKSKLYDCQFNSDLLGLLMHYPEDIDIEDVVEKTIKVKDKLYHDIRF